MQQPATGVHQTKHCRMGAKSHRPTASSARLAVPAFPVGPLQLTVWLFKDMEATQKYAGPAVLLLQ